MMDILMSETCWAHKKWNKIASDIKLVFYSSTITMMHGPINIRYQTKVVEKIKTHILHSITPTSPPPRKSCRLWDNVKKYDTVRQATDDNTAQRFACWISKATNTHSEYVNNYGFSTTKLVTRKRLNVTSYAYCLSFFHFNIILIKRTTDQGLGSLEISMLFSCAKAQWREKKGMLVVCACFWENLKGQHVGSYTTIFSIQAWRTLGPSRSKSDLVSDTQISYAPLATCKPGYGC